MANSGKVQESEEETVTVLAIILRQYGSKFYFHSNVK